MRFNLDKCHVMHFGGDKNPSFVYTMRDVDTNKRTDLVASELERDLGVWLEPNLKWRRHVQTISSSANRALGMCKRSFMSRDAQLWKTLYTAYIRPKLEFASSVWNPGYAYEIDAIEKIQHRATKLVGLLSKKDYNTRCHVLGLQQLDVRRLRGDLIQYFKIHRKFELVEWHRQPERIVPLCQAGSSMQLRTSTRVEHDSTIQKEHFTSKERNDYCSAVTNRLHFLTNRVAHIWNRLPESMTHIQRATVKGTVNAFKKQLDHFMNEENSKHLFKDSYSSSASTVAQLQEV
jgi:hypothetical protein